MVNTAMNRRYILSLMVVLLGILSPLAASVQFGVPEDVLETSVKWSQNSGIPGQSIQLALQVRVGQGWHINSHEPLDEFLIPTNLRLNPPEGITVGRVYYPEAHLYNFEFSENDVAVYEGTVYLKTSVSIAEGFTPDSAVITGSLRYQACNNTSCLPPDEVDIRAVLPIAEDSAAVQSINSDIFTDGSGESEKAVGGMTESNIATWLNEKGLLLTLLLVFLGGLALNLTPCVYPLIPITVSYFGGQAKSDTFKSTLILAVFYVLGMAITYSLLGTVAALTGQILGAALQNPVILGFIAVILLALAASMFGAYEITVPQRLASIGGQSRQGVVGSLFMGLTVGIIAAPCIGPFVLSLLIFVGDLGNPYMGFLLFFVLSLGLGLPFLVLGTFSGLIKKMPRSGQWMVWVRYVFGFILLGMAVYFLEPVFSAALYNGLMAAIAFAGAVFLSVITWRKTDTRAFKIIKPVVGVMFLAVGLWMLWPQAEPEQEIEWSKYSEARLQEATASNTPVIIDFYADWCIPCKELDKFTFTDTEVISRTGQFTMLKADLTKNESVQVQQLKQEYNIRGVPTIVFINTQGKEITSLRLTGYEPPEAFLERLEKL